MSKFLSYLTKYKPFSYLFLIAFLLELAELIFGKIYFLKISTWIAFYQFGVITFFIAWALFLGISRVFKKDVSLKEFVFSFVPVLVLLFLIELIFRFAVSECQETGVPTIVQDIYHPDSINKARETNSGRGQLNSHGFRGTEFDFSKKQDDYVMIVLGGSTATGAYASKFENIPSVYLEQHLSQFIKDKYKKNLKVYSLAEPAADIEDEAFWLFKLGIHLKPDAVISISGFNNMFHALTDPNWDFSSGARGFRRPGIKIEQNIGLDKLRLDFVAFADNKLNKYSSAYRYASCKMRESQPDPLSKEFDVRFSVSISQERCALAANRFVSVVNGLKAFCDGKKIPFVMVLQPFASCGGISRLPEDGSKDNQEQGIYRLLKKEINVQLDSETIFMDANLTPGSTLDSLQLFADSCHLWDNGFILLNDKITDFLKTALK